MTGNAIVQWPRFLGTWEPGEPAAAVAGLSALAIVAFLLYRFIRRVQWPRLFSLRFFLLHLGAALAFALSWLVLSVVIESFFTGSLLETRSARPLRLVELPSMSLVLYSIVAGIAYTMQRRARAAQAEAEAARTQLAALRAQLHPHFLFNALHTVVQLIPIDPARASEAAELVASLLRRTIEEDRDEVPLDDEWTFVSRYLEIEHIRFGDRLRVRAEVDDALLDERVPSFALQTLVENAVRHGAAPRVAPTEIVISAAATPTQLNLSVRNAGNGRAPDPVEAGTGTGLTRLRERLALLYGGKARLTYGLREDGDFEAALSLPRTPRPHDRQTAKPRDRL